ncbi:YtzI protein [Peribacillus glennii]|uniref:YtzI protein n=1 Tax=Peribacillus glennii TaxID=2303991 RepID=A0A372LJU6_9BACI|nr:YtzI protein [Peribacillus glennii]RFU66296.1 YtzI protein [Peribacillus glennii]
MKIVLIIGIAIVLIILLLSVLTINKGYGYKHTIDPIDPLPDQENSQEKQK